METGTILGILGIIITIILAVLLTTITIKNKVNQKNNTVINGDIVGGNKYAGKDKPEE